MAAQRVSNGRSYTDAHMVAYASCGIADLETLHSARALLPKAGIGYYPLQLVVYKLPVPGLAR